MHPVLLFDVNGSLYTCTGKSPGVSSDAAGAVASAGLLVVSCIVLDIGDGVSEVCVMPADRYNTKAPTIAMLLEKGNKS